MSSDWFKNLRLHPLRLPASTRAANGGAPLLGALAEYRKTERLPFTELDRQQRALLLALATHAAAHSPNFADRLRRAGLTPEALARPGGLSQLPPLTRQDVLDAGESLFCRSLPPGHGRVNSSSTTGSTGEVVTIRSTDFCQLHWQAFTLREHLWHNRNFAGRLAVARANISESADYPNWGPPCSLLLRTGPASAMPATRPVDDSLRWLVGFDPHYLLAVPNTLAAIVARLEETGQKLGHLRGVRTLGETVSDRLRDEVRRVLGLEIHDTYSSQEGGVMATQCPEAGSYHVSETILLEIVDAAGRPCAPGQSGRILVTNLLNFATPLIRYEIGDYAEVAVPCPCGRSLPSIRRFLGRMRNLVLLPDGTRHWPTFGFQRWGDVFLVRQFQFIQEDRHTIIARMSAHGRPTPEQEARLTEIICGSLGHPFALRFHWQDEPLPRGPGGKFEEFQCRVPENTN
jgi:phenylacetate-CoA ligase